MAFVISSIASRTQMNEDSKRSCSVRDMARHAP